MSKAQANPGSDANIPAFRQIGKAMPRTDAPGKVFGKTLYAGDIVMPGMLHAKVLRSSVSSAKIRKVDASKARMLDGVHCVLTAWELPDRLVQTDIPGQTGKQDLNTAQPILVKERVRYHGEPIALIAAETPEIAEQAIGLAQPGGGNNAAVHSGGA